MGIIRRIIRLDELPFVVHLERRRTEDYSSASTRIMRLVSIFTGETRNQSNNKCLPKFVQTDNASYMYVVRPVFMRDA